MERHPEIGFICPKCGSHWYGTHWNYGRPWEEAVGHCNDQFGKGCTFTWNRVQQDSEVMRDRTPKTEN